MSTIEFTRLGSRRRRFCLIQSFTLMPKPFSRTARQLFCACLSLSIFLPLFASAQQVDPNLYSGLRWRMIGPFRGGRTIAVSGIESQPNVYYFGGVGGGVWKTVNSGVTWE